MTPAPDVRVLTGLRVLIAQQGGSGYELWRRSVSAGHEVRLVDLSAAQAAGTMRPLPAFDVAVITAQVRGRAGGIDFAGIVQAAAALAPTLTPGATVILASRAWPGTTQDLMIPLLEAGSGLIAGADFFVGYSPVEGTGDGGGATRGTVVAGIDRGSLAALEAFYRTVVERTVAVTSLRQAELATLLETIGSDGVGVGVGTRTANGIPVSRTAYAPRRHFGSDRCASAHRRGYVRRDGRTLPAHH